MCRDLGRSVQGSALPSEVAALGWSKKPSLIHAEIVLHSGVEVLCSIALLPGIATQLQPCSACCDG